MGIRDKLAALFEPLFHLIDAQSIEVMGLKLLSAAGILLAAFLISRGLQRALVRRFKALGEGQEERLRVYRRVVRIFVNVVGFGLALHALGINMTHLFAGGGLLAVAMAFAMKNLAENLMSGVIMGLERSIKTGDVLQIEGLMVQVKAIGIRATILRTKDEQDLLIPNSQLVQSVVTNYSYRDALVRITAEVGVAYDAELDRVTSVLLAACAPFEWISLKKPPVVKLVGFTNGVLNLKVRVWAEDPWAAGGWKAELYEAIWRSLKEAGIAVAYPQLDVHVDEKK